MPDLNMNFVRETLLDKRRFTDLVAAFITYATESESPDIPGWQTYYRTSMEALSQIYINEVFSRSESPIERKFLNSLLLSSIKSNGLGLVMHPTFGNARQEIAEFRTTIKEFRIFWSWYQKNRSNTKLDDFIADEVRRGALPPNEVPLVHELIFKYGYVPLLDSYHLTIQPRFTDIVIDGRSVRPDMYFWIPNYPEINVVVECDGFQFHSSKEAFTRDRRRDRILKSNGFDVVRFSGSEIYRDPINVPIEIVEYLEHCKRSYLSAQNFDRENDLS